MPNLVTATVGANGQVTIFNFAGSTHVLFDVVGWYSDVGTTYGGTFVGVSPTRVLDTRFDFDYTARGGRVHLATDRVSRDRRSRP